MNIFDENEANYFCSRYDSKFGNNSESIKKYYYRVLTKPMTLDEGTSDFDEFRGYLLRHVERNLFLAAANYNIACKLMCPGFSCWNHISLYYGAFYSARAILGMFGVFADLPKIVVDVSAGNTGSQQLDVKRKKQVGKLTTYRGSHMMFWDIYYQAIRPLYSYITDPKLRIALVPMSSDPIWQVNNRNEINYDSYKSVDVINDFERHFSKNSFPSSLPSILNTQFQLTEALTLIAFNYAKKFKLRTDVLSLLPGRKERKDKIKRYIFKPSRGIQIEARKRNLLLS